ncbi:MAG: 50S ribosomal protein L1 [Omnitrophica WOR_2 bacterium GWF2_43_52]|nr:MAG: 50S ribosomal protein L1 [Omnitrophica WOR_2 bacterium GWC2_44_8]OGX20300.1 MAG: 50S ribosomal protein L1 [Omnitrophica WOR_2 bacterium GWF2_43_52]OGX57348.1 MAG: 50S ribosomal protein L1 [Omnitrophica WOR_2 bacterium RIFOXYC2_FULL_43_9]HAH21268.1 50S ribosomal protein L1 [Candidatus Omnitrophota bacterium]HBG63920.1 50S ribosomal protein L1 [Candidatus Omnitrophota bacterium]
MAKTKSKRYQEAAKLVDANKVYTLKEAIGVLKQFPAAKFNQSVDLSFYLNIDPKKSDQLIRGTVSLPHGTGKSVRVAVFCKGEQEKEAKAAGAEHVGGNDLIEKVAGGFLNFDAAVATPDMMKDLSRLGKVLGPRGLMPSPKTGTVTQNVAQAVKEIKGGKIEFKVDKQAGLHVPVGKINFTEAQIFENAAKVLEAITHAKPSSVKGNFIKSVAISCSMSPGLRLAQ